MDPATTEQAIFQFNLISNITSLAALAASLVAMIKSNRRHPPLAEEMYKDFVSKEDLTAIEKKIEDLRKEIDGKLSSGEKIFQDFQRVIGKLEGVLQMCPNLCVNKGTLTGEHR